MNRINKSQAWDKLKDLVEAEDVDLLEEIDLEGEPIIQTGVTKEEMKQQILSMAPGDHPLLPRILQGYIALLRLAKPKTEAPKPKRTRTAPVERITETEE